MDTQPWPLAAPSSSVKLSGGTTKALPMARDDGTACAAHGVEQTAPMMVSKVGSKPTRTGRRMPREEGCFEHAVGSLGTHRFLDGLEQVNEVPGHEPREALSHFALVRRLFEHWNQFWLRS